MSASSNHRDLSRLGHEAFLSVRRDGFGPSDGVEAPRRRSPPSPVPAEDNHVTDRHTAGSAMAQEIANGMYAHTGGARIDEGG
ncbi:hypothetical protein [Streptomyces pseudogriseolus]|uniref:hypothetical protein n=1 Tax=Streptomyces pseudogriseolus TaxID=36817 RepID=UPI003FA1EEA7